jgi:hypothetical protein
MNTLFAQLSTQPTFTRIGFGTLHFEVVVSGAGGLGRRVTQTGIERTERR